jgi:hypothetical protein
MVRPIFYSRVDFKTLVALITMAKAMFSKFVEKKGHGFKKVAISTSKRKGVPMIEPLLDLDVDLRFFFKWYYLLRPWCPTSYHF